MRSVEVVSIGAINWDINLFTKRLPSPGEEVEVVKITRVPGGTGANVAVAAARILGPGRVAFIGALGGDEIAEHQIANLIAEGVEVSGVKRVAGESGRAYIVIDDNGENEIHAYLGANSLLSRHDVQANQRVITKSKVLVITDPPFDVAEEASSLANKANVPILWDPGVYVARGLASLAPALRNVDYFILNQLEMEGLTETETPKLMGAKLSRTNPKIKLIVKQGSKGALLIDRGGEEITSIAAISLQSLGMRATNTVGCGDSFIGAFAASKAMGHDDLESIEWSNCAAAFKATRLETRGSPTKRELDDFCRIAFHEHLINK